jgi:hypothetical protein
MAAQRAVDPSTRLPDTLVESKLPAVSDQEKTAPSSDENESVDEPVPHLHSKTFLAVLAVCLIYFAQLVNLVGAGAVS